MLSHIHVNNTKCKDLPSLYLSVTRTDDKTFTPTVQLLTVLIGSLTYSLLVHDKSTHESHLHNVSLPYIPPHYEVIKR